MTPKTGAIFQAMTRNVIQPVIKATEVENFVGSPITYWCDLYAPTEEQDPVTSFQQMLYEQGQTHQTDTVAHLVGKARQELFTNEMEGFEKTLFLMSNGVRAIANMPLICFPAGLQGRPDLLIRVDDKQSRFGDYAYEVYEIKSTKKIKVAHRLQAAAYNRILGQVQGWEPPQFFLVGKDMEPVPMAMTDVAGILDEKLDQMRAIAEGKCVPPPCYKDAKDRWKSYVKDLAVQASEPSLINSVGCRTRDDLVAAGFRTVSDVAAANKDVLAGIKGIADVAARKISTSAIALTQDDVVSRGPIKQPLQGTTQVFIDLEGSSPALMDDGEENGVTNYLIGNVIRRTGFQNRFVPFFANSPEKERANLVQFLEWALDLPDPIFYHWHSYEATHLRKMSERYGIDSDLANNVLNRLEDLEPLVVKAFAFPTHGEGLKPIARYLGFSWSQKDVDAVHSMALYNRYVSPGGGDPKDRESILKYNEDDCMATMYVFDWLIEQVSATAIP